MKDKLTLKEAHLAMFGGKVVCSSGKSRYKYDFLTDSILEFDGKDWWESYIDPGDAPHLYLYEEPKPELRVAKTFEEALRAKKIRIEWPDYVCDSIWVETFEKGEAWLYEEITIIHAALNLPGATVYIWEE